MSDLEPKGLTPADREVIRLCLAATVDGPFFDDREFHTLFGLHRTDVASVLAKWPAEPSVVPGTYESAEPAQRVAVNNALNNLLGYPHGYRGEAFLQLVGASETQVAATLSRWRGNEELDPDAKGYFNRLM